MHTGILLQTSGSFKTVSLPQNLDDFQDEMTTLIGSEQYYLSPLISDLETERTIFLLMDVYNDFHEGPKPPVNRFISENSSAIIYGDVLVYLSEPDPEMSYEPIYDLTLTIDDLIVLFKSIDLNDRKIFSGFLKYQVLDDEDKRAQIGQILEKVGIKKYTEE